ncbi:MAG TPA: glucan 1,4-alpha-glucosidase [Puia sp.]|nr:glucan 1,4-alpha-glucosidase [Puia sp.]
MSIIKVSPSLADANNHALPSAPGQPGIPARWTSSAKTGVGTALSDKSRVWFTLSHGIFNEIYFPRIDQAATRDMGLIVTDGKTYFSEEKRHTDSVIERLADSVPAFRMINTSRDGRYRITKEVVADPHRDTVLQKIRFEALRGEGSDYQLYVLLAPHLSNQGNANTSWVGNFGETSLLLAAHQDNALALASSAPWGIRSAGFVGNSDGWIDLQAHKTLTWSYACAANGNTALTARIDLASGKDFVLALGFGSDPEKASRNAISSLRDGFDKAKTDYIAGWRQWMQMPAVIKQQPVESDDLARISLAVLRTHESKSSGGAFIASLALPWGFSKGDKDQGGYHLVWGRDMVEIAGGLLAGGAQDELRRALAFLQNTQHPDGHWSQNMWLDGTPYWDGIQMDETALPILLVDLAYREKALNKADMEQYWPMVRAAAGYLARYGPYSKEDRWEEDAGYTPFTVAAEIAGLLAAADLADRIGDTALATYLREIADTWNDCIDSWLYVAATDFSTQFNVSGYYVRIAPVAAGRSRPDFDADVKIKNVAASRNARPAKYLVSPDALALVRFGLRSATDPRIADTVKVLDSLLRIDTPAGPTWHRYNDDGYGEHADGAPFDGTGIGRGWPLLTGERAHFELMAGRTGLAESYRKTMASFANEGGLIPEQVWDRPDIPERELFFGRPSGSAMPLVWAHAEYLKLTRSLRDGKAFDLPPQTVQRYLVEKKTSPRRIWRFNHQPDAIPAGKLLRIETRAAAVIRWSTDNWKTVQETLTNDPLLGLHFADLETSCLPAGAKVIFTFYWPASNHWENKNFTVEVS